MPGSPPKETARWPERYEEGGGQVGVERQAAAVRIAAS